MKATRKAALERMNSFFENRKDGLYSKNRNYDKGKNKHTSVSMLSPYTRYRIILESELADLTSHSQENNEKFLKEVYWRTYWKGYLENFPSIWEEYKELCAMDLSSEISENYQKALAAETQFSVFNDWVNELKETGYLHNHARMWFASIWIHTLKLPWFLGADFFLRHLLDGDEAVNTLSWRWVAGLHTKGKSYLARPSNIKKYTNDRYNPQGLASQALMLTDEVEHLKTEIHSLESTPSDTVELLLVTSDDFSVEIDSALAAKDFEKICILKPSYDASSLVNNFLSEAAEDAKDRLSKIWPDRVEIIASLDDLDCDDSKICGYLPPVGRNLDLVKAKPLLHQKAHWLRRAWDNNLWPHATKGFFSFYRKAAP